jgi:vacuolar-type H+-ATPase subunit C/Vma6
LERSLLTPRRTVYQLRRHLADAYAKVIRLTPEPGRQLLLWLWRLYEVDNLKATLRGIETRVPWDQVLFLLSPMAEQTTVTMADMEEMVTSGDVARAVERIRHTPYYNTLSHALERYHAEQSLFPLEVALDLEYGRGLWQSINQLGGTDREQAFTIVGSSLDVDNLLWAIRYRLYHGLSEQEIINYTFPFGYRVRDEDIRAIAAGADIEQVVRRIFPRIEGVNRLGEVLDGGPRTGAAERTGAVRGEGLVAFEGALQRRIVELCRAAFRGDPFHVGVPVAYLLLNEYEIADLTVLIEAKASHLSMETFGPLLVSQRAIPRVD